MFDQERNGAEENRWSLRNHCLSTRGTSRTENCNVNNERSCFSPPLSHSAINNIPTLLASQSIVSQSFKLWPFSKTKTIVTCFLFCCFLRKHCAGRLAWRRVSRVHIPFQFPPFAEKRPLVFRSDEIFFLCIYDSNGMFCFVLSIFVDVLSSQVNVWRDKVTRPTFTFFLLFW